MGDLISNAVCDVAASFSCSVRLAMVLLALSAIAIATAAAGRSFVLMTWCSGINSCFPRVLAVVVLGQSACGHTVSLMAITNGTYA